MPVRLIVIAGPDQGATFTLTPSQALLLGRGTSCTAQLKDPHVSRAHCQIKMNGLDVLLQDLDSGPGTFLNGQKVERQTLHSGDTVQLGKTVLRVELPGLASAATLPPDTETTAPPDIQAKPAPGQGPANKPARVVIPLPGERLQELSGTRVHYFKIGALIGKGQTGCVFRARDIKNSRLCALKVLNPEFAQDDDEIQRFIRAVRTMLPLRHTNLVTLYGAGKNGPYCWIAMELIEGHSLAEVKKRRAGPVPVPFAVRVGIEIGRALRYAHEQQILHRNVTPANILVQAKGSHAKLGDLMMAKAQEGALAAQITRPGEVLGDIHFMSPERTTGGIAVVDARSDVYSLGGILYYLVTGRLPIEGTTLVETLVNVRRAIPLSPRQLQPALPPALNASILKALAKNPDQRQRGAAELVAELEAISHMIKPPTAPDN